jgi:hypothetical protein
MIHDTPTFDETTSLIPHQSKSRHGRYLREEISFTSLLRNLVSDYRQVAAINICDTDVVQSVTTPVSSDFMFLVSAHMRTLFNQPQVASKYLVICLLPNAVIRFETRPFYCYILTVYSRLGMRRMITPG